MPDSVPTPPGLLSPRVLRHLAAIFFPAAVLTGAVVLILYFQDLSNEHALHEQAGTYRIDLASSIIEREVKSVESDLLYLANQAALHSYLTGRVDSRAELQEEYLNFCRRRRVYDQIRYLDASGQERIRINYNAGQPAAVPDSDLQPKADRYYFAETMRLDRDAVFVSPFDLNVEHEKIEQPLKPAIRFATPIFDRQGARRGILVLNYLGAVLINKLLEVSADFPGQVWLLNWAGYYLRGPRAQDEWGFMLGHSRTLATHFPAEWPQISGHERGQFHTEHGLFTFRTLSPEGRPSAEAQRKFLPSGPLDTEVSENRLVVVAYLPPEVLDGRARQSLRGLLLLYGVLLVLVLSLTWYLAYVGELRRDHLREQADTADRLRVLSTRLLTAQEDERRSVSRDLHDELGQVVTSVTLDLQRAVQVGDGERKNELIGRALKGAGHLLDHIHEISTRLRPTLLDDLGLKDAVQSLLGDYETRTGITTRTDLHFEPVSVPPAVSENSYRILQEALTNVAKHAQATEVFVSLHVADAQVALTVRDNGVGLGAAAPETKRLGMLGMRERAELLNGTFVVITEPGRGTEVRVTIPLGEPAA
jgi:signal transduction histidine kinase